MKATNASGLKIKKATFTERQKVGGETKHVPRLRASRLADRPANSKTVQNALRRAEFARRALDPIATTQLEELMATWGQSKKSWNTSATIVMFGAALAGLIGLRRRFV